jgi:hypothetical protein
MDDPGARGISTEEYWSLPEGLRSLIDACEGSVREIDQFIDCVKDLRAYCSQRWSSMDGKRLEVLQRVLGAYKRVLSISSEIERGVMCDGGEMPDDPGLALLLQFFLDHKRRDDLSDELVNQYRDVRDYLRRVIHRQSVEVMDLPRFAKMWEDRARRHSEKRRRIRVKKRQERQAALAAARDERTAHLPPAPFIEDDGPRYWIMSIMRQQSSAGERVAPVPR